MDKFAQALTQVTGTNKFCRVFDLIEVCEQEINRGMEEYPMRAEMIYNMFMPLGKMASPFVDFTPDLFRSHCREIIARIGNRLGKEELNCGTSAECILCIYDLTMLQPVTQDCGTMYYKLWKIVFGEYPDLTGHGMTQEEIEREMTHSSYDGAAEIEIGILRKSIGKKRKVEVPTLEELEEKRADDFIRGNTPKWMEYQHSNSFQYVMRLEV